MILFKDYEKEEELHVRKIWTEIYLSERAQGSSRYTAIQEADLFVRDYRGSFERLSGESKDA